MSKRQAEIVLHHIRRLMSAPSAESASDQQLLERFVLRREEAAFAALLDRHGAMVLRVCRRILHDAHEAEDAFQATFLILARKAVTIRWHQSLSSWLYRVAYHVAVRARADAARREELAAHAPRPQAVDPLAEVSGRELLSVLDEELQHLPEKYRAPLVLCYLEGHTQDEASRQLGWSPHVLRGRVERGRAVLRRRLIRRGFGLSAVLATDLLEQAGAPAAAPATLIAQTLRAVRASPSDAAMAVSAQVTALAESGISALGTAKLKLVVPVVLMLGVLAGGLGAGLSSLRAPELEVPSTAPASVAPPAQAKDEPRRDRYGDPLPPRAVARLGTVRLRQPVPAAVLAFSPDGKTLASGGNHLVPDDRIVYLWDITTGKLLRQFLGHGHSILHLAFSPDGKTLVSASRDQTIRFWNVTTGKEVRRLRCPDDYLAFSPDGRQLATTKSSPKGAPIMLWNPTTGEELLRLHGHEDYAHTLAFSPNGKMLASLGEGPKLFLWDVIAGKEIRCFNIGKHQVYERPVAFTPDGKHLITGDEDGSLHLWDVASGEEVRSFRGHKKRPVRLIFSADGKVLISVADDRTVRFWDVAAGEERRAFTISNAPFSARSTVFSPGEKMLAVGAFNNAIRLWDMDKGKELLAIGGHQAPISSLAFSLDGKAVTSVSWDDTFRRWDATSGQELRRSRSAGLASAALISIPLAPDDGQTFLLYSACLSTDGQFLFTASGGNGFRIHLWEVASGREIRSFAGHTATVGALAVSPDSRFAASSSWDKSIRLWDVATGKELHRFPISEDTVFVLCFSADGRWLAAGDKDRMIRVWEVATGKELHRLRHGVPVFALVFSPDGRTLAAAGGQHLDERVGDGGIVLWEMATGEKRGQLAGHDRAVMTLSYSPDGHCLASGGTDGTVRIWEPFAGKELCRFLGRQGYIKSLAFSADGQRLASGGMDTTALIWDVGWITEKHLSDGELTDRGLQKATIDLLGQDAGKAYQAMRTLAAAPHQSLSWLKKQLKPAAGVEEQKINQLIEQLDDDTFAVREKAMRELERLRESAEPFLRKALQKSPTLEKRRRIEQLLEPFSKPLPSVDRVRQIRMLELLEQIDTKEATELLKTLAGGAPGVFLTREAKASLDRLARQSAP
jgi:RNA polymerase sigma factor (sigma-70 family)